MKIADLRCYPLRAPLAPGQATGQESWSEATLLLVRLETDTGIVGWGEAYARYQPSIHAGLVEQLLKPIVIGADAFAIEALWQRMSKVYTGRSGGVLLEAIAAVDIALWDVLGHHLGEPLYRILGHNGRTTFETYAAAVGWVDDESATVQARQFRQLGFKQIKVRLGPPLADACARASLIRETVGEGFPLLADCNRMFKVGDALKLADVLADLGYHWLEEPLAPDDIQGYRTLARISRIQLAAGESEYSSGAIVPLLRSIGVVQPDVARSGGITETRRIVALANAFSLTYSPHIGFSGAVCAAASLHLAASAPNFEIFECIVLPNPLRDEITKSPVFVPKELVDGRVAVTTEPGLGIIIDEEKLRDFADPR